MRVRSPGRLQPVAVTDELCGELPSPAPSWTRLAVVRKQYHFWPGDDGLDAWDVDRLIELSQGLPVKKVNVSSISEVDTVYWFSDETDSPTVRSVADHARLIREVDMSYPIILGYDGRVMDGMHRIARALLEGRETIDAVQFENPVPPDHRHCHPNDLPYD